MTIDELKQTAVEVRKGIVTATHAAKSGHPGGSLSATEIFTYLYFEEMILIRKIRRKRIVTVLSYRRDIRHRDFIPLWQTADIFR